MGGGGRQRSFEIERARYTDRQRVTVNRRIKGKEEGGRGGERAEEGARERGREMERVRWM